MPSGENSGARLVTASLFLQALWTQPAIRIVAGRYRTRDGARAEVDHRNGVVHHVGEVGVAKVRQGIANRQRTGRDFVRDLQRVCAHEQDAPVVSAIEDQRAARNRRGHDAHGSTAIVHDRAPDDRSVLVSILTISWT